MKHNEQGSTLIIVIWFIAIIAVIVTFLFYRTESEWAVVVDFENQKHYSETAEDVLHQYLALLAKDDTDYDTPKDPWYAGDREDLKKGGYQVTTIIGGRADLEKDGYQVTIMIEDEGSKSNLNTLSDKGLNLLAQLIESKNSTPNGTSAPDSSKAPIEIPTMGNPSPSDTQISLDPLLDWRDRDSEPRDQGAELQYYQGLNPPYKLRDGFLASLEEMKQLKNGAQIYGLLVPEVTVFGKINPNTISGETFSNLLNSTGEYSTGLLDLDSVADQFESYRAAHTRFDTIDALTQLNAIHLGELDKIRPFLQISGACNVNMASDIGLTAILKEANYSDSAIQGVLNLRKSGPVKQVAEVNGLLGYQGTTGQIHPDDYLTTTSTIIHYRIWVRSEKGTGCYYLDTVWQREAGGIKKDWQIKQLSFRELWNQAAPEIPKLEEPKENEEDQKQNQNSSTESNR